MADNNKQTPNRIPVRFVNGEDADKAERGQTSDAGRGGELTPDEIGRASAYDDATEVQRRIDRGAEQDNEEGRGRADDADAAGGPDPSELPRSRNEQDTTVSHADDEAKTERGGDDESSEPLRSADPAAGPVMAELVATRAELRRVEGESRKMAEERQELADIAARRQADFENYRKRVERERAETYQRVVGDVVKRLFPVMDNLQRALAAEASVEATESEEFRHFLHGIELVRKQLNDAVEGLGVESVPTVGQPFDPHIHEAVATEETDEFQPDMVTAEMQRGYRLGDKLLRPAMVKVATRQ
ncbi:MAG: nucleotide exchange factor GrpE [Acidobacteria bacterium]|nr:nucleotide exchange factor GrpE [Acidobacteriota bacterium]